MKINDTHDTEGPTFTEVLVSLKRGELDRIEAALKAIAEFRAAEENESEKFAAYLTRGAHGNTVRAAERRSDRAQYAAIDAVGEVTRFEPEVAECWGFSVLDADLEAALERARVERVEFIESYTEKESA